MKKMISFLVNSLGYEIKKKSNLDVAVEATEHDWEIMRESLKFSMTSPERLWALINAVSYTVNSKIPGVYVECGVWRGGSAMAIASKLLQLGANDRQIWLYDTFSGMTQPTAEDIETYSGTPAQQLLERTPPTSGNDIWCIASLSDVTNNVYKTGYGQENIKFIQGDVQKTLVHEIPDQIALLRLDTDWYQSTKAELEILFPRLSPGGVCIIDDYGHWEGARKAVNEYFSSHNINILLNRIDYSGRIFIKT